MKFFLRFAFILILLFLAVPASAQLHVGLQINVGPPPPPADEMVLVNPHHGTVWIAGFYRWHPGRHRYLWVRGHWDRPPRPRSVWVPGRWEVRRGEYVFYEGRWEGEKPRRR